MSVNGFLMPLGENFQFGHLSARGSTIPDAKTGQTEGQATGAAIGFSRGFVTGISSVSPPSVRFTMRGINVHTLSYFCWDVFDTPDLTGTLSPFPPSPSVGIPSELTDIIIVSRTDLR
jgi:hypothetical protein